MKPWTITKSMTSAGGLMAVIVTGLFWIDELSLMKFLALVVVSLVIMVLGLRNAFSSGTTLVGKKQNGGDA